MASPLHSAQVVTDGIHIIHAYEYANAAARTAATGFVAAEVGKVARQLNDNTFWVLVNHSPVTWGAVTGSGGTGVGLEIKEESGTLGNKLKLNFVGPTILAVTDGGDATQANVTVKPSYVQSVFNDLAVDTTTTSAAFVTLITQAIVIQAGSILLIHFTVGCSNSNANNTLFFRVRVDGVTKRGVGVRIPSANQPNSGAIVLRVPGLAAGSRSVTVQWRTSSNTAQIRPATVPDAEHACLLLEEVLF